MLKVVPVKISEHFEETRKLSAMHWQETESDFQTVRPNWIFRPIKLWKSKAGLLPLPP